MEGNDCYKYSTIQRFVRTTNADDIQTIVDVGVNVGDTLLLAHHYFPRANIVGYEPVYEYYMHALERTKNISKIVVRNAACTGHHLFEDDLGLTRRGEEAALCIYLALPESGPGWLGGSRIDLMQAASPSSSDSERYYKQLDINVTTRTLEGLMSFEELDAVDILKLDCEGSEFCLLGSASPELLNRIRFICGEYHDIQRFYKIMEGRLFATHKVSLVGERWQGSFFAERLDGEKDGILRYGRNGMKIPRANLGDEPICWNVFNETYVIDSERAVHGYAAR